MSTTDDAAENPVGTDTSDTDALVADPEAAERATRERMSEQAQQEREAGHPVSSDPTEEIEPPAGSPADHADDAGGRHSAENAGGSEPSVSQQEYPSPAPDTAPAGVPSPAPETQPVPDVEPVPGVSPDPSEVPGDPTAPDNGRPPLL